MTLVSVVLPTYKRAGTIARAVRSVLAQTHSELELIIVDDGPDDGTAAIIGAIGDARVRYLRFPQRMGVSRARNVGMDAAKGELIAFQDSDDEWRVEKLARQVAAIQARPDASLVGCGYFIPEDPGHSLLGMDAPESVVDITSQVFSHLPGCQCWLTRRSALKQAGDWDTTLDCFEDWELGVRLSLIGRVLLVNEPLVIKPMTPGSLFSDEHFARNLKRILARHEAHRRAHPKAWTYHTNLLAQSEALHGSMTEARRWFRESIAGNPSGLRAWTSLVATFLGPHAFAFYLRSAKAFRARFPTPVRPRLAGG